MFKNRSNDGRLNISGLKIRKLRKAMPEKTSQRAFAYLLQLQGLDLEKNAIQRIESGERFVTDIELKAIAPTGAHAPQGGKTHCASRFIM